MYGTSAVSLAPLRHLVCIVSLSPHRTWEGVLLLPHLPNEETEAQREMRT